MVTARGSKSFIVQYRAAGKSRRLTLKTQLRGGLSLNAARKEAKAIIGAVIRGGDPLAERRKTARRAGETLRAIVKEYFAREGNKLRSAKFRRQMLERHAIPTLGDNQAESISRSDLVRLLDGVEDKAGPSAADATLSFLGRVFNWHAGRSDTFRSPIVRGMQRVDSSKRSRQRILSDDELRAIWRTIDAEPSPFGRLVQFLLLTATRRSEAAGISHGELVGSDWTIPGERYKSGLPTLIPLSSAAKALLDNLPKVGPAKFFFTATGERPISERVRAKRRLDEASGVTGWRLHDLRRTGRSLLSRAGVPANVGERCLGLIRLRWSDVDFKRADIAVKRLKNGKDVRHPLDGSDLRGLRALHRDRQSDEWIFMSERGPFTRDGFAKMLKAAADRAGIENVHPHALRHACGHALAMKGRDTRLIQDYLGHRNIQHTSLYTDGISTRFKGIWD